MTATVLYNDRVTAAASAQTSDGQLWLNQNDFAAASGWRPEPEGLCRGDACIRANDDWVNDNGAISLSAFAAHMNQPALHDQANDVWSFGESAGALHDQMFSLTAPDFTLPDLDGNMHSLSDYRGKKVFMFSWGSY